MEITFANILHLFIQGAPLIHSAVKQGGRSWQPFIESKNCHKNVLLARIRYFCDKWIVRARHCTLANLTQFNMQYIVYISALLAQKTLFLTQIKHFFAQRSPKSA